jgi:hypothetical protein
VSRSVRAALAAGLVGVVALALSATAPAGLQTGFADPLFSSGDAGVRSTWLGNAKKAKSEIVRIDISWRAVAPASEPGDATDPGVYNWGALPAAVADAESRGLKVLLTATRAPSWAEAPGRPGGVLAGTWKPDPDKFGEFAQALAAQFGGSVRHYQAWVEPNLYTFLNPQYTGQEPFAPDHYRKMLNAFYGGINAVQPGAVVVTAGTAPYGGPRGSDRTRPLAFWRDVLCLRGRKELKPVHCATKAKFDALAHHPINTSGGPNRSAVHPDDVSTPDVKHLVRTLRKAEKRNRVGTNGRHPVWLTEFWWETRPPDKCVGIAKRRHASFIKGALRSFKRQGAAVAINFLIRDQPYQQSQCGRATFQTGAFFANGTRKPAFKAFRRFGR